MSETTARNLAPDQAFEPVQVLKREAFTRVEVITQGEESLVRKHYLTRRRRLWWTILFPSRAFREYRNLAILRARGVSCLEPVSWTEERGPISQVSSSTLITRFHPGTTPLRKIFQEYSSVDREGRRYRLACGRAFGLLLKTMHQAGVMHGRASTKDFLVAGSLEAPRVIVCDVPYAACFRRSILGLCPGVVDLYHALFTRSRKRELAAGERLRILDVYTGGDKQLRRRLWRRLGRRSARWNTLQKISLLVFDQLVFLGARLPGRVDMSPVTFRQQTGKKG